MKRSHLTAAVASGCLALALSGFATSTSTTPTSSQSRPGQDSVPLIRNLAGVAGPVPAGWYYLPLWGPADGPYSTPGQSPLRAIVQIPPGFTTSDGYTVVGGDPDADSDVPTLAVARGISRVDTEPCGGGRLIDPGPSVRDLADAIAPHAANAPRSATVDGSDGLYLEFDPPDGVDQCPGGIYRLLADRAEKTTLTSHLWVLNVEGHRVVVTVRTGGESTGASDEMAKMAESLLFVHVRAPH